MRNEKKGSNIHEVNSVTQIFKEEHLVKSNQKSEQQYKSKYLIVDQELQK
jgi:hypothetical protein